MANAIRAHLPLERQTQGGRGPWEGCCRPVSPAVPCCQPLLLIPCLPLPSAGPTAAARAGGTRGAARVLPVTSPLLEQRGPSSSCTSMGPVLGTRGGVWTDRREERLSRSLRPQSLWVYDGCHLVGSVDFFPWGPCLPSFPSAEREPTRATVSVPLPSCVSGPGWRVLWSGLCHTLCSLHPVPSCPVNARAELRPRSGQSSRHTCLQPMQQAGAQTGLCFWGRAVADVFLGWGVSTASMARC